MDQGSLAATLWTVDKRDSTSYKRIQCSYRAEDGLAHKDIRPSTSLLFPGPLFCLSKPLHRWIFSRFLDSRKRAKGYSLSAT